jgi:electron transfer flavoprotein alpha subunit
MEGLLYIIAEQVEGKTQAVTYELVSFARELQKREAAPPEISVLLPGRDVRDAADGLARATGLPVTAVTGENLEPYNAESHKSALMQILAERKPRYICLAHTSRGSELAPALAVATGGACITAVESLEEGGDAPLFVRTAFRGKFTLQFAPQRFPAVVTVLPGSFARSGETAHTAAGSVTVVSVRSGAQRTKPLGVIDAPGESVNLAEADVIVSAGNGIGAEENLALVTRLAGIFPRSAVGGSRIVCDQGWLPYAHQVGVTGKTVSPKLYVACGISGAIQHLSGMRGSQCIVAVNKDPRAAIFQVADYGVVDDLTAFIPAVLATWEEEFSG